MSGYPIYPPKPVWFDQNGDPLTDGTVEFFLSGTANHADIFLDIELTEPADNPITLNSRGEPQAMIYAEYGVALLVEVRDAAGALVYTADPYYLISGSGGVAFATNAETATGGVSTKAVSPASGASAYDRLATPNQHTAGKATADVALVIDSGLVALDCEESNCFRLTLTGNCTLSNPVNPYSGQVLNVVIKQDPTGGRTLAFGTKYKFPGATTPTVSPGASDKDMLTMKYDVADDAWLCSYLNDFG